MTEKWYLGIRESELCWSGNSVLVNVESDKDQIRVILKENYFNYDYYSRKLKKDLLAKAGDEFIAKSRYPGVNLTQIVESGSTKGIAQCCHLIRIYDGQVYIGELLTREE